MIYWKDKYVELITSNRFEEAIILAQEGLKHTKYYHQVLLLKSRYYELTEQRIKHVMRNEEYSVNLNKIRDDAFRLISHVEMEQKKLIVKKTKRKRTFLLIPFTSCLVAFLLYFNFNLIKGFFLECYCESDSTFNVLIFDFLGTEKYISKAGIRPSLQVRDGIETILNRSRNISLYNCDKPDSKWDYDPFTIKSTFNADVSIRGRVNTKKDMEQITILYNYDGDFFEDRIGKSLSSRKFLSINPFVDNSFVLDTISDLVRYCIANQKYKDGDYAAVRQVLRQVNNDNEFRYQVIGSSFLNQANLPENEKYFTSLLDSAAFYYTLAQTRHGYSVITNYNLAQVYINLGEIGKAKAQLSKIDLNSSSIYYFKEISEAIKINLKYISTLCNENFSNHPLDIAPGYLSGPIRALPAEYLVKLQYGLDENTHVEIHSLNGGKDLSTLNEITVESDNFKKLYKINKGEFGYRYERPDLGKVTYISFRMTKEDYKILLKNGISEIHLSGEEITQPLRIDRSRFIYLMNLIEHCYNR